MPKFDTPEAFRLQGCSVAGCARPAAASRGMCWPHYKRDIRYGDPAGGHPTFHGDGLRWIANAVAQETDECLPYPAGASVYGVVELDGECMSAPRVAAIMAHGPANGRIVTHSCRTKPCCNKRHISWGTPDSNMKDRVRDGTQCAGEASVCAKLRETDVLAIRQLRGFVPQAAIAKHFKISQTHVSEIQLRKTWKHI